MKTHIFNTKIMMNLSSYYSKYDYAYGTFEFDTTDIEAVEEFIAWGKEYCIGDHVVFDTSESYFLQGVKDVTVFAFMEEADAVAFKLMWT